MGVTTEEFVTKFHSLTGTSIGERRKNLFLLLKRTSQAQELRQPVIDCSSIHPKTPLEETFKVEVLIHFRKVPELVDVLKGENPILIEKILKTSWFLLELLKNMNESTLVEELFPCLSFNTKVKILNKLSVCLKNTEQADLIFEAVQKKYGMYLASKLLPCCSEYLIMRCVRSSRIEITPRQLLLIVKKYPQLTKTIIDDLTLFNDKYTIRSKYKIVFMHIINKDAVLFLKLHKDYHPCFRLGWRATNRFVLTNKRDVIENAKEFYEVLHQKQIVESMDHDYNEFYYNLFPGCPIKFSTEIKRYLDLLAHLPPGKSKIDLLLTTFRKAYDGSLWDHPTCITSKVLELMSPDEREAWMQSHEKPCRMDEDVWTCLKKTSISMPTLQKRISLAYTEKEKAELIGCLVETCRINGDRVALTGVCKYVVAQHRHESSSVLYCFLTTLKDCFCLNSLDDEQWKYINEIVKVFTTRGDMPYYYHEWLYAYVEYRIANGMPIEQELIELSKKIHCGGNWYYINTKKPEHQKQCLLAYAKIIRKVNEEDDLKHKYVVFLDCVINWNNKHPQDALPFSSFTEAITTVKEAALEKTNYSYLVENILGNCIKMKVSHVEREEWLNLLCSKKEVYVDMNIMNWLLKYDPLLMSKQVDTLANQILDMWYTLINSFFWKHSRNYGHLEIPQKIKTRCLNIINTESESDSRKKNAVTALSCIMEPAEFLQFISPYYPDDTKMDVNDAENQEKYKMQQAITGALKNVIPSSVTVDSVIKFSTGDYLKFIQRSLHSVSLSAAEKNLKPLFAALTDHPVSVRKHVIYHTFKVLDRAEIYTLLSKLMPIEKNSSIRKFMFKATFNYFIRNPDEYIWGLVKENIKAVDINDSEAFEALMQINKVPPKYLPEYLMFTWEILEKLPNPDSRIEDGKCRLLDAVSSSVFPCLTDEFCLSIMQKYFLSSKLDVVSFACKYVIYATSEVDQKEHLNTVLTYVKAQSNEEMRSQFVNKFCSFFIEQKCTARDVLIRFIDIWCDFLKPHQSFELYVSLQLTLIYVDYKVYKLSLKELAEKLTELCDPLLTNYGLASGKILWGCLQQFTTHFLNREEEVLEMNRLTLVENIITVSSSPGCILMAISLLPQTVPDEPELEQTYNRIISIFSQLIDPVVQVFLSSYLYRVSSNPNLDIPDTSAFLKIRTEDRNMYRKHRFINHYTSKYRSC